MIPMESQAEMVHQHCFNLLNLGATCVNYESLVQEVKSLNVYKFRILFLLLLLWLFKTFSKYILII